MLKSIILLPLIILIATSCSVSKNTYQPNKKYSPQQLKEDFRLMSKVLKANHPSLYWYTTKDSLDAFAALVENSITDSLTEPQFKNKLAWFVSKIHCGHTSTRPSIAFTKYYKGKQLPRFPLNIKVWKDSAVVISNLLTKDSTIKRGNIITSINQFSTQQIIDSMCSLMSTDGYNNNFKLQAFSFNFPAYFNNAFGIDSQYVVAYIDNNGKSQVDTLKNFKPMPDTGLKKTDTTVRQKAITETLSKKEIKILTLLSSRNLKMDTANRTAYLAINTFSKGKLNRFFRKSFADIKKSGVNNLVIDLRQNTGGDVMSSTKLTKYLANKPFLIADNIASTRRGMRYKSSISGWFWYWWAMQFSTKKMADGKYHFQYLERHHFQPKKKNHFDGNIYLITGGYTFSAASIFTNNIKGQNNAKVVGEETGGGSYGNSAIFIPDIVLPNTTLRVRLPLFRMVLNKDYPKNGRGIFPDEEVLPSSYLIQQGIDGKMEQVKMLIRRQRER